MANIPKKKSLETFKNTGTSWWMPIIHEFVAVSVRPCAARFDESGQRLILEPCEAYEASCWTLYGRDLSGGSFGFEDFSTKAAAKTYLGRLITAYPHLTDQTTKAEARKGHPTRMMFLA